MGVFPGVIQNPLASPETPRTPEPPRQLLGKGILLPKDLLAVEAVQQVDPELEAHLSTRATHPLRRPKPEANPNPNPPFH